MINGGVQALPIRHRRPRTNFSSNDVVTRGGHYPWIRVDECWRGSLPPIIGKTISPSDAWWLYELCLSLFLSFLCFLALAFFDKMKRGSTLEENCKRLQITSERKYYPSEEEDMIERWINRSVSIKRILWIGGTREREREREFKIRDK